MVADTRRVSLDWNDVRFFLAVARERTLARAGVALGVDQTTVGRRLASLEEKLRVALFVRSSGGFLVPVLRDREAWCTVWLVLPQAKRRIAAVRVISEAIHGSFKRSAASALPRHRALAGEVAGAPGSDP